MTTHHVDGLIRSLQDATDNVHPYPILVHPLWFRVVCVACNGHAAGPQRATIATALADRIAHAKQHNV